MMMRRHLRLLVILWLAGQTVALSAFRPAGCCPAHQQGNGVEECHGDANGVCPMHASATAEGSADTVADPATVECPMHVGAGASGLPSPCVMRGLCDGPSVALSILFSVPGVLVQALPLEASTVTTVVWSESSRVLDNAAQHDTPPPRL